MIFSCSLFLIACLFSDLISVHMWHIVLENTSVEGDGRLLAFKQLHGTTCLVAVSRPVQEKSCVPAVFELLQPELTYGLK